MSLNNTDISVIILLYKTNEKKLKNLINYKKFNIYILDQSNDHKTKTILLKLLPNIKYYKVSTINKGFAAGVNFLVKKIKSEYFFCTQADVNINFNSIINLKKVFKKKNDCIIAIPKTNIKKKFNYKKNFIKVKSFYGSTFMADRKKFLEIGSFNEDYFFYWEDIDLSKKITYFSKYNIYKCQNSIASHDSGNSSLNDKKTKFLRYTFFKYGEYLYQYNFKKLKLIKMIREPILLILNLFYCLITIQKLKFSEKLYNLNGIFVFYKFLLKKNFKK